jgi:tetratricopeptide (TPR) repeat protein
MRLCSRCKLEIPNSFPDTEDRLCPGCYQREVGACMLCGGEPVRIVEHRRILGLLFLGFRGEGTLVLCVSCTRRIVLKSLLFTAAFGWLGFAAFYRSFVGQAANVRSLFRHPALAPALRIPVTVLAYFVPIAALAAAIVILAAWLASGASSDPFRKPPPEVEEYRATGEAELEKGHPEQALAWFRKAVDSAPDFPPNRLGLGYALERLGRAKEAEEEYRKGLEKLEAVPYPQLRLRLANLLLDSGRPAEAAEVLRKEVEWDRELAPDLLDLHRCWQDAMAKAGRRAEALEAYRARLLAQPEAAPLLYLVGRIEAETDPAAARARFRAALEKDPGFFLAALALGRLELRGGALPASIEAYRQALKLRPDSLQALFALGETELLAFDLKNAEARFAAIASKYPDSALGPIGRGRVELARGNAEAALGLFEDAVKGARDPFARSSALLGKGMSLSLAGKGKEALDAFEEAGRAAGEPELRAEAAVWAAEAKLRILQESAGAEWKRAAAEGPSTWAGRVAMMWTGASGEEEFWKEFAGGRHSPWAAAGFYFEGLRFRLAGKKDEAEGYFDRAREKDAGFYWKLVEDLKKRS